MDIGTSPYNFVPLNEHIYFPEWAKDISMDIPFEDGEDGIIEVEWINDSPLFTRDVQNPNDKDAPENQFSMHIPGAKDGTRRYFLPGSSLRGMLRNVLSILSFGKMNQFTNRFYGYREFGGKDNSNHEKYQSEMKKIRYGWLKKDKGTEKYSLFTRDDFYWNDVDKSTLRIHKDELKDLYPHYAFNRETSSWEQNELLKKEAKGKRFPKYENDEDKYRIFATGKMNKKEHEVLIPIRQDDDIEVKLDDDTVKKFFDVYEPSPNFEEYRRLLDDGEEIPVSYIKEKNGIVAIGMGKMIRYPYQFDVEKLVKKQQCEYNGKRKDLCEAIFGWVDKDGCMKGRVQVGNAFASEDIADDALQDVVKGVLGTPRGSFYPFYIKQDGFKYKTYEDANGISGRKLYRIHSGGSTMDLPKGNGNENVGVTFKPIPSGQKFTMRINVHNLRKVEVGALLSAITLHKQSKVWHNIGLAKSFGFGKLHCESLKLHGFTCNEHEYIIAFERQMNEFTKKEYDKKWLKTKQSESLFSIMSQHKNEDLKMMVLDEYTEARKNSNRKELSEAGFNAKTVQTPQEEKEEGEMQFRQEHRKDYEEIKELKNSNEKLDLLQAISLLNHLIDLRLQKEPQLDTQEDEERKTEIEKRLQSPPPPIPNQSLTDVLEETYPNKDEYKVKELKVLVQKCKKWMQDHDMDGTAKDTFIRNIERVKAYDEKKYGKQWKQNEKFISTILSQEEIDSIRP